MVVFSIMPFGFLLFAWQKICICYIQVKQRSPLLFTAFLFDFFPPLVICLFYHWQADVDYVCCIYQHCPFALLEPNANKSQTEATEYPKLLCLTSIYKDTRL